MALSTTYNPAQAEEKWYDLWMKHDCFRSKPDHRPAYSLVIPPPNVTGVLHLGHMLNNTIQDVLARKARLDGKNVCWVPGTDHASIATETKVVNMLLEQGINKDDIGREEFLRHAWAWKEKYGGIILHQLKKLGASLDWEREAFTMSPELSSSVTDVFIDLYRKGYVYRGVRMVNWDPIGKTAVADDEVVFKTVASRMCHLRYRFVESPSEYLVVATVRPETIMADRAVCVHPDDPRYQHLHGKMVRIPLTGRSIPIIADPYVSMDFGTGCLKVTPAHDPNDYALGQKFGLEIVDILDDHGKINEKSEILVGEDRFVARKKIIKLIDEAGDLEKIEDYQSNVGHSERTNAVIEPRLSMQWFVRMEELTRPALEDVLSGAVRLHPDKFLATYRHWMDNVRDWCISRQLWWGHRIPAWHAPDGSVWVERTADAAASLSGGRWTATDLKQDEDVLDTWFSSWLWPLTVFDPQITHKNPEEANEDLRYYYPTQVLVTGPDILFFWVARMMMAGRIYMNQIPFHDVYLTGIVRDKQGRKMSKSLGNSPDPLDLIDRYGADSLRMGLLLSSPAGNDLLYDEALVAQGRNFANKIWNAFRLIQGWQEALMASQKAPNIDELHHIQGDSPDLHPAVEWFGHRLHEFRLQMESDYAKFRLSDVAQGLYKLIWDDFCSWYLEMIKPPYGSTIEEDVLNATRLFLDTLLQYLHPVMPFLSEELWHALDPDRRDCDFIGLTPLPGTIEPDVNILRNTEQVQQIIVQLRNFRNERQLSPKHPITLWLPPIPHLRLYSATIARLAGCGSIEWGKPDQEAQCIQFLAFTDVCFADFGLPQDLQADRERIQTEIQYLEGFLASVQKKLSNERFVASAPESVLAKERQKESDALLKLANLRKAIA
ncbi:MAG: valine--tRNA ligase [Bacteroidetes bacterium]|nr:valine--tRNA ligase [Bacteroidota bacterium]